MPEKPEKPRPLVSILCAECGGGFRKHQVLQEHTADLGDESFRAWRTYQICQCRGCDTIRFREASATEDDVDYETGELNETVKIYPERLGPRRDAIDTDLVPEKVERIYQETIRARNAGAPLLTGGGLRAIVEALCLEQGVVGNNLQQKIDNLATKGYLAKAQADLLHEERFLGNAALHELVPPEPKDLAAGLDIVETLLKTIYVPPARAKEMRKRRGADGAQDPRE